MQSSPRGPERVYVDTMVFVYHLWSRKPFLAAKTKLFFEDVDKGKYKAVTSTFTKTEFVGVLKLILSEAFGKTPTDQQLDEATNKLDEFLAKVGFEIFNSDDLVGTGFTPVFTDCHDVAAKADSTLGTHDNKWRSVGGCDALITVLAERSQTQWIATFDQGYKGIKRNVKPMILQEVY